MQYVSLTVRFLVKGKLLRKTQGLIIALIIARILTLVNVAITNAQVTESAVVAPAVKVCPIIFSI